ncbi:glycosyltransferase [Candidatus Pacearchaeota archaeon]|nr:glycosyltransferase [Candidatus Pacearchaeota archaeon]
MTAERPLVSFVLLAYKQEQFIREAVRSVLEQTYEPLEIIFSDDCSPDLTFDIIKEEANSYRGSHKIILNRNEKNLGIAGNLNRALELTSGQFIVGQAGDDISLPNRTRELINRLQDKDFPVDLVCSYFAEIDVNGELTGFIKRNVVFVPNLKQNAHRWKCGATGACVAYSRKLYDKYGPIDNGVISEDWVFSFRAWLESGIAVIEEPLVHHRTHDNSISVQNRTITSERNATARRLRRKAAAENIFAISKEWLRAWQIHGVVDNCRIEKQLFRRLKVRELQLRAYDSNPIKALKMAFQVLIYGGGISRAAQVIVRHVLRQH